MSLGTASQREQLNDLEAGNQSRSPAFFKVTPKCRVLTVRSVRLRLTDTRQDAHTLEVRSRGQGGILAGELAATVTR